MKRRDQTIKTRGTHLARWIKVLESRPDNPAEHGYVITRGQMIEILTISHETMARFKREGVLKQQRTKYCLSQALEAFKEIQNGTMLRTTKTEPIKSNEGFAPEPKTFTAISRESLSEMNARARAKDVLALQIEIRIGLRESQLMNNERIESQIKRIESQCAPMFEEL